MRWSHRRSRRFYNRWNSDWRRDWRCRRSSRFRNHTRRGGHRSWRSSWPHPRSSGCSFFRYGLRLSISFCLSLSFSLTQKVLANFLRDILRDRARMRLLFRDAIPRQKIDDRLGLDFEFAGQFVDSDLVCFAHAAYRPFHGQKTQSALTRPLLSLI